MASTPATATAAPVGVSCRNCPSFLVGAAQRKAVGTTLNGPLCGRKMLPLVRPTQDPAAQARTLTNLARGCSMYGEEVMIDPLRQDAAPDMPVGIDISPSPPTTGGVTACYGCKNFISPSEVQQNTGWTSGICRATGNLIPDSLAHNYAKTCGKFSAQVGPRKRENFSSFTLFPQFSDSFGKVDPVAAYRAGLDAFVDPREYPTDRPVTPRMAQRGIRAWRRVSDPDSYGPDVFLPIFDESAIVEVGGVKRPLFSDEEKSLIPRTGDRENPELYADHGGNLYTMVVLWMKLDETPALWGAGGTGKTEFARYLAWLMGLPFHRININGSSEVDDLAGKILFEEGATRPHYGRLSKAWVSACILLLDEPNTGPPEVWQLLRPLFDNSRMLTLDSLKGERSPRHSDCYPMLAMNPSWSPLNVGAQVIGDADASRLMHMYFDYPPVDLEKEIIQRRLALDGWQMAPDQLAKFMTVAKELRSQCDQGVLHHTWGVRHQIKAARALRYLNPIRAYRRAIADMLEPEQLENVLTEVKSQFGE